MAELKDAHGNVIGDTMTEFCNALAELQIASRKVAKAVDEIYEIRELKAARSMMRMEDEQIKVIIAQLSRAIVS
jgi:hypothetical protein